MDGGGRRCTPSTSWHLNHVEHKLDLTYLQFSRSVIQEQIRVNADIPGLVKAIGDIQQQAIANGNIQELAKSIGDIQERVESIGHIQERVKAISELELRATITEEKLSQVIERNFELDQELTEAKIQIEKSQDYHAKANNLEFKLNAIEASISWRITKPLRLISKISQGIPRKLIRSGSRVTVGILIYMIRTVVKSPAISHSVKKTSKYFPTAYQYIRLFAHRRGLLASNHADPKTTYSATGVDVTEEHVEFEPGNTSLSPKAHDVYTDIKNRMSHKDRR